MGVPQRVSNIDTPHKHTKLLNNERRRLIFFLFQTHFCSCVGQFFGSFYGRLCDFKRDFYNTFLCIFVYLFNSFFYSIFNVLTHQQEMKKKMRNLHISNSVCSVDFFVCGFYANFISACWNIKVAAKNRKIPNYEIYYKWSDQISSEVAMSTQAFRFCNLFSYNLK